MQVTTPRNGHGTADTGWTRTVRRVFVAAGKAANRVHRYSPKTMAAGIDHWIRRKPGQTLILAALGGFVLGFAIRRR